MANKRGAVAHLDNMVEVVTPLIKEQLAVCQTFPTGAAGNMTLDARFHHELKCMVLTLHTYLTKAAHPKPMEKIFEAPATWWQMFKRDYFPAFLLARFPVEMETTTFRYDAGTFLCPHMELPWTERQHIDFITLQEKPVEGSQMPFPSRVQPVMPWPQPGGKLLEEPYLSRIGVLEQSDLSKK